MENNKRLIVVLGMHRSGTSVITRGLQVMGVELGEKFLPPQEDNITGFWEDLDINALNIEMLNLLGSDWYFLTPVRQADVRILRKNGYIQRAIELLRNKTSDVEIFGFKDPRVAKLLPFWKEVFKQGRMKVSYVLTVRHPLSVCKSLEKRDGFDLEKSSLLWLEHIISSLAGTLTENCVVVDYDHIIQSPDVELKRIAKGLQLQIIPQELEKFKAEFLDKGLRHTTYQLQDLILNKTMSTLVQEVYSTLIQVATDNIQLDDAATGGKIARWKNELSRLIPSNSRYARLLKKIFSFIYSPLRSWATKRDLILIRKSGLYDEAWYLANNPDVARSHMDPARHYLLYGGFDARDPSMLFDSDWYLNTYPDVKKAHVNPLVHYLKQGWAEGRQAQFTSKPSQTVEHDEQNQIQ